MNRHHILLRLRVLFVFDHQNNTLCKKNTFNFDCMRYQQSKNLLLFIVARKFCTCVNKSGKCFFIIFFHYFSFIINLSYAKGIIFVFFLAIVVRIIKHITPSNMKRKCPCLYFWLMLVVPLHSGTLIM